MSAPLLPAVEITTPWLKLREAAAYEKRGARWLSKEARDGRVRHAIIGGKRELFFRREWLDEHIEAMATPVIVPTRRRA